MELIGGNGGDYPRRRGEGEGIPVADPPPPKKKVCALVCGLVENLVLSRF